MLERILEANDVTHELTDDEVRDEVFTLFLAVRKKNLHKNDDN